MNSEIARLCKAQIEVLPQKFAGEADGIGQTNVGPRFEPLTFHIEAELLHTQRRSSVFTVIICTKFH
jgi:hypothetical protein